MAGPFYFAYVAQGVAFNAVTHAVEDEPIFNLEIAQSEGDFATLTIEVPNPTVGLLSAGRDLWCWLSYDFGSGPQALFNGRLIGVPEKLGHEVVRLQFVARPADYIAQQAALASALKTLPWYDEVWLQDRLGDPNTVLETRAALWDINRVTLTVSTTDIVAGEAGTLSVGESDHLYDAIDVSYAGSPLRRVAVTLTAAWKQAGSGELDLSREMVAAFQAGGSPTIAPMISSLTGPGLADSWPKAGATVGEGWSVASDSALTEVTWIYSPLQTFVYTKPHYQDVTVLVQPGHFVYHNGYKWVKEVTKAGKILSGYDKYALTVPLSVYLPTVRLGWTANRQRSETVSFTVEADVQSLLVDPGAAETETIGLNSSVIDQPIDAGDALPVGDPLRPSYFKQDRGARSLEYGLLLARARLIARARAVRIKITMPWTAASTSLTCRHNIALTNRYLPGTAPQATGKVAQYSMTADGDSGEMKVEPTLACTIGHGVALAAALGGTPDYVEDGYVDDGYQTRTGGEVELVTGALIYESPDNFVVVDDGLDLTDVVATKFLVGITVTDGPNQQRAAIQAAVQSNSPQPLPTAYHNPRAGVTILYGDVGQNDENEPTAVLTRNPTTVRLEMVPIGKQSFAVTYTPTVSELVIPKTIDLEAA